MFNLFKSSKQTQFWLPLDSEINLNEAVQRSKEKPIVIFKHSTRCSISSMAKSRLESHYEDEVADFYYLDLIQYRTISNAIANLFGIEHQSPQVLLILDGKCVYSASHEQLILGILQIIY